MQRCYILPMTAEKLMLAIRRDRYLDTLVGTPQLIEVASYALNIVGTEEEDDFEESILHEAGLLYDKSIEFLSRTINLSHCYMSYIVVDEYGTVFVTLSKKVISCPQRSRRTI